jgi:hypothetical protein
MSALSEILFEKLSSVFNMEQLTLYGITELIGFDKVASVLKVDPEKLEKYLGVYNSFIFGMAVMLI